LNAPRVRFAGVYIQKEKYTRPGTKDLDQFYDPVHLIEFYRHFRFYPDGFVVYLLSVKKLTKEQIIKMVHRDSFQEGSNTMKGEYIVREDKLFIKLYSPKTTVFDMELKISSRTLGQFDLLQMESHFMRILGQEIPIPMKQKGHMNKKFKFNFIPSMLSDKDNHLVKGVAN
jgi:F-box protein 9